MRWKHLNDLFVSSRQTVLTCWTCCLVWMVEPFSAVYLLCLQQPVRIVCLTYVNSISWQKRVVKVPCIKQINPQGYFRPKVWEIFFFFLLLGKSLDFAPLIIKVLYAVRQSVDSDQPLLIKVLNAIQRSVDCRQQTKLCWNKWTTAGEVDQIGQT